MAGDDSGGKDPIGADLASSVAGILGGSGVVAALGGNGGNVGDLALNMAMGLTGSKIALGGSGPTGPS